MPRPSIGCANCRIRKIKCDKRGDSCSNCERYGVLCPGYPQSFDVLHRHHVPVASSSSLQERPQEQPESEHGNQPLNTPPVWVGSQSAITSLRPDADQFILGVYYASYCIEKTSRWSLQEIQREGNGCLLAAVNLMGFQVIAQRWDVANRLAMSAHRYATAVRLLNEALASPVECVKDSTLMATILMSAVETMACSDETTRAWEAHSLGASALLQQRGPTQVTSQAGSAMFFHASFQIFTSSLLGRIAIPPALLQLIQAMERYVVDLSNPLWRWHQTMVRFVNFVAGIPDDIQSSLLSQAAAHDLVTEALEIHTAMKVAFDEASSEWQYTVVPCLEFAHVTEESHEYRSITASQLWNGRRTVTIMLHDTLRRIAQYHPLDGFQMDERFVSLLSEDAVNKTAEDCIRAAPQVLAVAAARVRQDILNNRFRICHDRQITSWACFAQREATEEKVPMLQGCLLQWSLYFAAKSDAVGSDFRRRIVQLLKYVGDTMHIQQWSILGTKLQPLV